MTGTTSFDVRHEPWLPCMLLDGSIVELSLVDALDTAPTIRRLVGDLPTQPAALLRLMLAILHRTVRVGPAENPYDVWGALWKAGRFDVTAITTYLDRQVGRFDLLHPETPFLQVADLRTATGEFTPLARLIPDVPAKYQYFTTRSPSSYMSMSFAEAARWLVHTQAFDASGIKSGALGDERVKGGKGYPIGIAWTGGIGLVVLEGDDLFQTLMLNLVLADAPRSGSTDSTVWERGAQSSAVEEAHLNPTGVADLLTWQSRRLRLEHDGERATGVLVCNGDALHPRNQHDHELMTPWRRSQAQEKATGIPIVMMPRIHQPDRAAWRGLGSLLALAPTGSEPAQGLRARTLSWVAELREDGTLPRDFVVRAHALGLAYGSNNSVVDDLYDDTVSIPLEVLANGELRQLAVDAVRDADVAVFAVADLSQNLVKAAGGEPEGARSRARETAYDALDPPYRAWLAGLIDGSEVTVLRERWQRQVRHAVADIARVLIDDAGDPAWIGREVASGSSTRVMNSAVAERIFWSGVAKALPLASQKQVDEKQREASPA